MSVHCNYGAGTPCDDTNSVSTDVMVGNATCLKIAFEHRKEEVANGTVVSLVILNATTLNEIEHLRQEFILHVQNCKH